MTFGQLNSYIITFANHISSQEVNPDSAIKSERFGCVSLAYSGTQELTEMMPPLNFDL